MEIFTLWHPAYWAAAGVKVVTASASVTTALLLFPLAPKVITIAETARLSEQRRIELEKVNEELHTRTLELEESNRLLADQQKKLVQSAKMSALGEMAGGIAHEINSPLGIIVVNANQLERLHQRNLLTPEIMMKTTKLISETAKRIGNIIKGLRSFARDGSDDPFELTTLHAVVQDALILCQNRFKMNEVDLKVFEISSHIKINCRPTQVTQVILNLLNNAFDAVQAQSSKWVKLEVLEVGEVVKIMVTDSGSGIPKEVGKGTGLGLSISKGIIDSHRGHLKLDPNSPHTRFIVELPKLAEQHYESRA